MTSVFLLQLVLPLLVVTWLAFAPLKSKFGFFCQAVGTAVGLFGLALTGLWLFPPWWTPYALAGLLAMAVIVAWRRLRPFTTQLPLGWKAWIFTDRKSTRLNSSHSTLSRMPSSA